MGRLALVMIVKNEARGIRATLASVRPFIDHWTILDTGSTDGTPDLVADALRDVPGNLAVGSFVDFATTRNQALAMAGTRCAFTLMLSGDETLHGGEALRAFCEAHADDPRGAHFVPVRMGDSRYDSARLARASAGWRYVGVTHEVLTHPREGAPTSRVDGACIDHDTRHRSWRGQRARWRADLALLTAQQKRSPDDTRTAFYFAQSLECLGRYPAALAAYRKRVAMGGWHEEVYESLYRIARVTALMGKPLAEVQQRYLEAYAHSPTRAEPLYEIAWRHFDRRDYATAYLFASQGARIPYPEAATLFVEAAVYHRKLPTVLAASAYYVGQFDQGERVLRGLLARYPGDAQIIGELACFERRR